MRPSRKRYCSNRSWRFLFRPSGAMKRLKCWPVFALYCRRPASRWPVPTQLHGHPAWVRFSIHPQKLNSCRPEILLLRKLRRSLRTVAWLSSAWRATGPESALLRFTGFHLRETRHTTLLNPKALNTGQAMSLKRQR